MLSSWHHHLRAMRSGAFSQQPSPPTARPGSVRRCSSPTSPPPPPPQPPPPPPLPPPGGGSGGGGGRLPPPAGALWLRRVLQAAAGVLGAAGVLAAALPSVLSTQWGLENALELINSGWRLPGRVEVAGAQLSWLGGNELQCVKVYDSPRGGTILLHLNKVSTSSGLWHLVAGGGSSSYNLVIAKPWINTMYDARISDFKLVHFLEQVGLLRPAPPPPPQSAQSPQLQPLTPSGGQAGPSLDTSAHQQPQGQNQEQVPGQQKGRGKEQQEQQRGRGRGSGGRPPTRLIEVLERVNSKMELNADVRMGRMNVMVTDGLVLVPEEIRQILGPRLHITGAIGERALREWAEEVGEEVAWADRGAAAANPAAGSAAATTTASPPQLQPPAEVLQQPGLYQPGVLQVLSEHLRGEMRLWDGPDHSLLHQPATASLDLTPALSRLAFAATNPVLGNVVEVRGGGRVSGIFNPDGGRLPYQAATIEMEPVSLELGPSSMVLKVLGELGLSERARVGRNARRGMAAAAAGEGDGDGDFGLERPLSAVSVSRMRVHFHRDGHVRTERVDMRLGGGGGGGGVHMAVWGGADLPRDVLQFTLGVSPGWLLAAMGLGAEGLPPGYLLLVPVRGAVSEPRYDVAAAAVRLGQLGVRQRAAEWVQRREAEVPGGAGQGRLGALAAGLGALVSAVSPPEELVEAIDRVLVADMVNVPPPPPPMVTATPSLPPAVAA